MMPPAAPPQAIRALEDSLLHRVLEVSGSLQRWPRRRVLALMAANAVMIAFAWSGPYPSGVALGAGALTLGACLAGWALCALLPRAGRSFGPDQPPALGLMLVLAVLGLLFGVLGAPLWLLALADALLLLVAAYATWIEPMRLGVTQQRLALFAPGSAPPLRVLHLGDLHLERITARERALQAAIAQLRPDVIVFSGDLVNLSYRRDPHTHAALRELLDGWRAPLGVFLVPGTPTVEQLDDVAAWVTGLDHITLLPGRTVVIDAPAGRLAISGMITTHLLEIDRAEVARLGRELPPGLPALLLAHAPDVAPEAAAAGFRWMLCGHTHGGQIRLPLIGALLTSSHYGRRFVMGRHTLGAMTLYTTRGIGMEGLGAPRARLLCPPEIVLWEIT